MTRFAGIERDQLVTLLHEVGPQAPTLCKGWNTTDLAAHLVARERRFDSTPGLFLPAAAGWTDAVRAKLKRKYSYSELVELVRAGPQFWNPLRASAIDERVNLVEFFVHHEDVRRARSTWSPRDPTAALEKALWKDLRRMAPTLVKKAPVGVRLEALGVDELVVSDIPETTPLAANELVAKAGTPYVTLRGLPSELLIYCYGRNQASRAQERGNLANLEALRRTNLGY